MISRKKFLIASVLATVSSGKAFNLLADSMAERHILSSVPKDFKICIFSKCLQWLNYTEMITFAAEAGFDGIDLTVRKNGHILPENVVNELPKAVKAAEEAGIKIYMLTTDINDAKEKHTLDIIKTAGKLGIKYYRTNWYQYDSTIDIPANIEIFKNRLKGLSILSKEYGIEAVYQNHAGLYFGASIWDLWMAIKDLSNISCQYDIRHATVEGTNTWVTGLDLIHQKINTIAIKDFALHQEDGKWTVKSVPLGEGIVNYPAYLKLINKYNISGPATMHFEYPLGGAEDGAKKITMDKDSIKKAIIKDLDTFRKLLK